MLLYIFALFLGFLVTCHTFNLTILHTNDFHARYEQINALGGRCSVNRTCYGGIARQITAVRNIRNQEENVIFLNAGDYYQGTIWHSVHRWRVVAEFTNRLRHDVLALGNHEFDDGIEGLVPFVENATFPIISSNINTTGEPTLDGKINKSVILSVGGKLIGVIGYTTKETPELARTGQLIFLDEIESIKSEAEKLQEQDVQIIIALGHAGFEKDLEIAKEIPAIDVVVGGHTNTFLFTGNPPVRQAPSGPYPMVVEREDGSIALVVQDYAFGKYLGYLKVRFNESGHIEWWGGNPILLDESIPQDNETMEIVAKYKEPVDKAGDVIVGNTNVYMNADRPFCRLNECNFGNIITDAVLKSYLKKPSEDQWTSIAIAVFNSGGIRESIDENEQEGKILMRNVMSVLPYRNTLDVVDIYGRHLKEIMERSVYEYDLNPDDPPGRFLQVAGMRVTYNISQEPGHRVHSLLVHCTHCRVPEYLPVNESDIYRVVMPTYLTQGGDGYKTIPKNTLRLLNTGKLDVDIVVDYLRNSSTITTGVEGRILFIDPSASWCSNGAVPSTISNSFVTNLLISFVVLILPRSQHLTSPSTQKAL